MRSDRLIERGEPIFRETRTQAHLADRRYYQSGPCVNGHRNGVRFTSTGACVDCQAEAASLRAQRETGRPACPHCGQLMPK